MISYEDIDKVIYECECEFQAVTTYEDKIVDGLVSMKVVGVIDTESASVLLNLTQTHTAKTFTYIVRRLSGVADEMKLASITPDDSVQFLSRILVLVKDIRGHKTKDEKLVREVEYSKVDDTHED